MPPLPTLPTELIDEILLESVLSEGDLVRCCLVSRQFLFAAQQLIYHSIQFTSDFTTLFNAPFYANPWGIRRHERPRPGRRNLHAALRHHSLTSSDCRYPNSQIAMTASWQRSCWGMVVFYPSFAWSALFSKEISVLTLTVLDIGEIFTTWLHDFSLDFYDPGSSRLEVVRLPIHVASTTLSGFKHLRHVVLHHVELTFPRIPDQTLIADCTALKTLAFEFLLNPPKSHLLAFLLASPASLTRLEFHHWIPFDVLASLLDPSVRPPFRLEILALSAGTASEPDDAVQFANQLRFTVPPLPTLPTELIDEVLVESVLSEGDLVRCCLVSRQFLPLAQQLLYYSVQFTAYFAKSLDSPLCALSRKSCVLLDTLTSSTSLASLSMPLNIEKLRCWVLTPPGSRFHLPAALTVLDIDSISTWPFEFSLDFYNPGASRLEVIRLPFQPASINLGRFKHLRHLVLHQNFRWEFGPPSSISIAACHSLKTLAFEFDIEFPDQLIPFLRSSPPSLARLEFSLRVPYSVLASLLDPTVRLPFRLEVLALSAKAASDPSGAVEVDNLRSLCAAREIKIVLMKRPRDVFYV
ncbi:hypothetical protein JCM11491_005800 [Sporobolomyces phaffii]